MDSSDDFQLHAHRPSAFASPVVDRLLAAGGAWQLPGGQLVLPKVFGFCRGVTRALEMLERAVRQRPRKDQRLWLLGQIIHNPWVNEHFQHLGVRLLDRPQMERLEQHVSAGDCAIIPAFGIPLPIERRLRAIGCDVIDTTCGDVRRLWLWATRAAGEGCGVLIFGRADHDETVVTKSRLQDCGGKYVVVGNLSQVRQFCGMITGELAPAEFARAFGPQTANTDSIAPFERLAQVSQTTMLYDETMEVRDLLAEAFERRFGRETGGRRLLFEPTVCKATQARQAAAMEVCQSRPDLVIVVGGYGSSNTRHLYELARSRAPAYFIENAQAIVSADELRTVDLASGAPLSAAWLPPRRPLRIAVLAGASSPEIVVGEVLEKIAGYLA